MVDGTSSGWPSRLRSRVSIVLGHSAHAAPPDVLASPEGTTSSKLPLCVNKILGRDLFSIQGLGRPYQRNEHTITSRHCRYLSARVQPDHQDLFHGAVCFDERLTEVRVEVSQSDGPWMSETVDGQESTPFDPSLPPSPVLSHTYTRRRSDDGIHVIHRPRPSSALPGRPAGPGPTIEMPDV